MLTLRIISERCVQYVQKLKFQNVFSENVRGSLNNNWTNTSLVYTHLNVFFII